MVTPEIIVHYRITGVPCWADHFCGLHYLQIGSSTDWFSPLKAYVVPSGALNSSPQGGSFHVSCYSILPSPVSEVCGVLSKEVLLSSSLRKLETI